MEYFSNEKIESVSSWLMANAILVQFIRRLYWMLTDGWWLQLFLLSLPLFLWFSLLFCWVVEAGVFSYHIRWFQLGTNQREKRNIEGEKTTDRFPRVIAFNTLGHRSQLLVLRYFRLLFFCFQKKKIQLEWYVIEQIN